MDKAFRFYEYGGPEVLRLEDLEIGAPGRGQVRIVSSAIAVNFRDVLVRRGTHTVPYFPSGIGVESVPGSGATFWFTVPVAPPSP